MCVGCVYIFELLVLGSFSSDVVLTALLAITPPWFHPVLPVIKQSRDPSSCNESLFGTLY